MENDYRFYEIEPTSANYWRAIVLFGRNVASYKFALAKSLYSLREHQQDLIKLEELAPHFTGHLCEHLKKCDKQIISKQSRFLEACRSFNANKIDEDELRIETIKNGFNNVIDAFHNVHGEEVAQRFFIDERKENKGIRLTDQFYQLAETSDIHILNLETEARWRLVETAWELNMSKNIITVEPDIKNNLFEVVNNKKRVPITSCRDALNGYQKSRCFYCYRDISIEPGSNLLADVDHFFPHKLNYCSGEKPINGVANLVLACKECNRGERGKFDKLPSIHLLERLHRRNEYLIKSHHPLRETLMLQTGFKENNRQKFLQNVYDCSHTALISKWEPLQAGINTF